MRSESGNRRYRMMRVRKGEYILPANDGVTLWRISAYTEDGSASYDDGMVIRGRFWRAQKWLGTKPSPPQLAEALEASDYWRYWSDEREMFRSREEAIQFALEH